MTFKNFLTACFLIIVCPLLNGQFNGKKTELQIKAESVSNSFYTATGHLDENGNYISIEEHLFILPITKEMDGHKLILEPGHEEHVYKTFETPKEEIPLNFDPSVSWKDLNPFKVEFSSDKSSYLRDKLHAIQMNFANNFNGFFQNMLNPHAQALQELCVKCYNMHSELNNMGHPRYDADVQLFEAFIKEHFEPQLFPFAVKKLNLDPDKFTSDYQEAVKRGSVALQKLESIAHKAKFYRDRCGGKIDCSGIRLQCCYTFSKAEQILEAAEGSKKSIKQKIDQLPNDYLKRLKNHERLINQVNTNWREYKQLRFVWNTLMKKFQEKGSITETELELMEESHQQMPLLLRQLYADVFVLEGFGGNKEYTDAFKQLNEQKPEREKFLKRANERAIPEPFVIEFDYGKIEGQVEELRAMIEGEKAADIQVFEKMLEGILEEKEVSESVETLDTFADSDELVEIGLSYSEISDSKNGIKLKVGLYQGPEHDGDAYEAMELKGVDIGEEKEKFTLRLGNRWGQALIATDIGSVERYLMLRRVKNAVDFDATEVLEGTGEEFGFFDIGGIDMRNQCEEKEIFSLVLDFLPIVGTGKAIQELVMGYDLLTGEKIPRAVTTFALACSILPGGKGIGSAAGKAVSKIVKKFSTKFHKRTKTEIDFLRNTFNKKVKAEFLEYYSATLEASKKFTPSQIKIMEKGILPKGWIIHHKKPLFRGGDNSFSNLRIMKKELHTKYNKRLHYYEESKNIYRLN